MATLTKTALFAAFDADITTNANNEITGAILNGILKDIGDSYANKLDENHFWLREYDPTRAYAVGMTCLETKTTYKCTTGTTGAFNPAHWEAQNPAISVTDVFVVADIAARDALTVQTGDVAKVTDAVADTGFAGAPQTYIWDGSAWIDIQETSDVVTVNGLTGTVSVTLNSVLAQAATTGNQNITYSQTGLAAVSTLTQLGSRKAIYQNTLWDGGAEQQRDFEIYADASTTTNEETFLKFDYDGTTLASIMQDGTLVADAMSITEINAAGNRVVVTKEWIAAKDYDGIVTADISNWDTAFGWGDHAGAGYLTVEADPVFTAHAAFAVTSAGGGTNFLADDGTYKPIAGDGDGIYDGSGTAPTTTVVTLTDNINFASGLFGIGVTPSFKFHMKGTGSGTATLTLMEDVAGADRFKLQENGTTTFTTVASDALPVYMIKQAAVNVFEFWNATTFGGAILLKNAANVTRVRIGLTTAVNYINTTGKFALNQTTADAFVDLKALAGTDGIQLRDVDSNIQAIIGTTIAGGGEFALWNGAGATVIASINRLASDYINTGKSFGFGIVSPDGFIHIHSATAGAVTASASADELVIENSGAAGLSILTPAAATGNIFFGDVNDNDVGQISYSHTADKLSFVVGTVTGVVMDGNKNLALGTLAFDGTAVGAFGIGNGTEPGAAIANGIQIYAKDSSVGSVNSTLGLFLEQAVEAIGTFTPSHKLRIWVNGTEYDIQLDAV